MSCVAEWAYRALARISNPALVVARLGWYSWIGVPKIRKAFFYEIVKKIKPVEVKIFFIYFLPFLDWNIFPECLLGIIMSVPEKITALL